MIELPDLPYKRDALEPHVSKQTLDFHYGKHHKGYVDNLNKLIKGTGYEDKDLEDIVTSASGTIYNNAAQVWNHTFFWQCMTPDAESIDEESKIGKAIDRDFGGYDKFKEQFVDSATKLFGSGWLWLVEDNRKLKIKKMKDAREPLTAELKPILVCDLWEHSYYLDYQNDRAKYVEAFCSLIDWKFAESNLAS